MSNTRRAAAGLPLRQERFASSPQFNKGLMANLVARRCQVIERREDRKLVWFLQHLSHSAGGLRAVADELLTRYPDRASESGTQLLGGASTNLSGYLEQFCLDPSISIGSTNPWYFQNLIPTLREFQSAWSEAPRAEFVLTEIGKRVFAELDYALETRTACMINGRNGAGKSRAAKAWCQFHPGEARYVDVPSSNDDIGFYRNIAKSLGVSINQNSKAQELRQRIEDTLQAGDLMLVFDEAHYLWPNLIDPRTLPTRINWLMTALINSKVPVVMITTPQFHRNQRAVEEKTRWTSEQFMRRIEHCQPLPDVVPEEDFFTIASFFIPEGDAKTIEMVVGYAQISPKYLSAIEPFARRARFLAKQSGREKVCRADVIETLRNYETPSDNALAGAVQVETKRRSIRTPGLPAREIKVNEPPTYDRLKAPALVPE